MLGRKQAINLQVQQFTDGILLVVLFWLTYVVCCCAPSWLPVEPRNPSFSEFRWLLVLLLPFGPLFLELQGFYEDVGQKPFGKVVAQIVRAGFWLALLIGATSFLLQLPIPGRPLAVMFVVLAIPLLAGRLQLTGLWLGRQAAGGRVRETILLAGTPADVAAFRASLAAADLLGIAVAGEIDLTRQPVADLVAALHRQAVSRVIFAGAHTQLSLIQEAVAACEIEGVEAWLVADFVKTSSTRPEFDYFGRRPVLVFRRTPALSWALLVKSATDFVGTLVLLVLAAPLFALAAIGIRLTSPGPVIFRQVRAGKNGRPFTMFKFRSMHTEAEMQRVELEAYNQMSGPVFKIDSDPRVTPFGRFLRKTSIDELPQLINVLQGDMSLVGPRPLPIYEVEQFRDVAQRRRLSVKPGLTCLWQISGRSKIADFAEWVRLDLEYIDHWSLWLDFSILLRTIPAVLFKRGAH